MPVTPTRRDRTNSRSKASFVCFICLSAALSYTQNGGARGEETLASPDDADTHVPIPELPPQQIKLDSWQQAISLLRASSASLHIARLEEQAAAGQRRTALGAALPNVSASAFTRKDLLRGRICDPNSLVCVTDEAVYGGSISITQPLIAPATWVAVRASSYGLEAREHAAADMQRTLAMQMVDAIAAVLTQERLISTARTALRATIERARLVKTGMKLGSLTSLDVLRAEQDVALVQKIVLDFRSALSQAQEDLGAVLGQAHPVGVSDAFRLNSVAAGCQPRVADRRHDILAAQLRADASRTELKQIRMQFLPSLNFIASFNLSSVPYADDRHRAFVVGGDLTFPLFDGGVRYGQLRTAEAAAAQADERAKSVASTARLESVRAERKVAAARDALEVTKRAFSLAVETERLARAAISVGSGTVLELIDAGRRLRESEAAVVVNETEFLAASVQEALVAGECQW